ncbi:MAG: cytochrome c [Acidobacteriota bacterium]|nr:cytochrome c [Acidobacteriota bacterium]
MILTACGKPLPPQPQDPLTVGKRIYFARCVTCHQRNGSGTLKNRRWAADFTEPGGVLAKPDEELVQSIMKGKKGDFSRMPAFEPILSPEQVDAVLLYIRKTYWQGE